MSNAIENARSPSVQVERDNVNMIEDPVGRLLTIKEVCDEIGLSRAMVYRLVGYFENPLPKPIKIGNASRWSLVEIIEWKKKALAERD